MLLAPVTAGAQAFQDGYVTWGMDSQGFASAVKTWAGSYSVNEDDNFFISRVKPKERFRNEATQVRQDLTAENDKKLIAWVPVNTGSGNALPDGKFDSEVFSMWPYVTHWGDWTAPLGRVPGAFLDAAHKNGVGVSSVASIPYGAINFEWSTAVNSIASTDAETAASFMRYYGVDGLGYNSEFSGMAPSKLKNLRAFHEGLVRKSRETNPLFENFWYDGTNDNGIIWFDHGLGSHNKETFGDGDHIRTSLFLNYNWNSYLSSYATPKSGYGATPLSEYEWDDQTLLASSVTYARSMNRDPLDLYAGVNMQGGEPGANNWPLLQVYPISIGLWGAHSENMWWESRGEKGSDPAVQQRTYMLRTERWFTGGTRNPANCPEVSSSMKYVADNYSFHGMSSFMTARSSLKWSLSEEPFVSYFNLGNGQFFNWKGVRQNNKEWYNIGVQDYLPTWRWWFASSLLGRTADDVPSTGLDAEFTWDDAYVGGSSLRIYGTTADEYLHLFKTEYALQAGDVITVRYKVRKGAADMNLVLTAKGAESAAVNEGDFALLTTSQETDEDEWAERTYTVSGSLAGSELALVALHFKNAADLDLCLGEFSIVRGTSATPAKPQITKAEVLAYNKEGVDAKVIFNMANSKAAGEPCYNIDVNTSLFKLYSQQEGEEAQLVGITTSWAALFYSAPMNVKNASGNIRFGVSALSLDMKSESEIAWSQYLDAGTYVYSDDIQIDKTTIKPNEDFTLSFVDVKHESATWSLYDDNGTKVFEGTGNSVTCAGGLPEVGSYSLKLTGPVYADDGVTRMPTTREYGSYVQITSEGVGALPKILTLTANDKEADIEVKAGDAIALAYTGRHADGAGSQGVDLAEQRFGAKCADLGLVGKKSFSVACWLKINKLADGDTQLFAVANKLDNWPKTDWGWIWTNIDNTGAISSFTFRGTDATSNKELQYKYNDTKIPVGTWAHLAFVFDWNPEGNLHADFYLNGVKQEIKGWTRTGGSLQTAEPGYQEDVYAITDGMVLSMGGNAHGRSGIDGVIDNLIVWDKAISQDEVKAAMGDIDPNNLASSVLAFWNLEESPSSDFTYPSAGSKANVAAGLHNYEAAGGEGQGTFGWIASDVTAGCPFVTGTAFPVTTLPTWKTKKGTFTNATGNDESGAATLAYSKGGDYTVTLTLANSLGSDSRTFQVIKVTGSTGIEQATNCNAEAYVVSDKAFIDFADAGNYTVRVFNAAGQMVASKSQSVSSGQKMQITLGHTGTYVLTIQKDGASVRSVKLLCK